MSVEYYKKLIIDLRAKVAKEKELRKNGKMNYAKMIKRTYPSSSKAAYRKSKVDKAAYHDRQLEYLKKQIESAKQSLNSTVLSSFNL